MRLIALALVCATLAAPAMLRAADIQAGEVIFNHTCRNCHSMDVGVNKVGPSLWHIVGRPSATVQGYAYSDALKSLHTDWTPAALTIYLQNPRADVHGAQMFFKGLPDPQDRADVIAYLQSLQ